MRRGDNRGQLRKCNGILLAPFLCLRRSTKMKPCGLNLFNRICLLTFFAFCISGSTLAAGPKVDFRDLAIFVQFWLSDDCNTSNHGCYGADLDHWNDMDYDGYFSDGLDCDDLNPNVHPGGTELPDGVDNNCNGIADEGWITSGDIIIRRYCMTPLRFPMKRTSGLKFTTHTLFTL